MSVYFLATEDRRFIKIGRTKQLDQRLKAIQNGCPMKLELIQLVPGHEVAERIYHETFAENRIHGEWFRADEEMLRFLAEMSPDWTRGDTEK